MVLLQFFTLFALAMIDIRHLCLPKSRYSFANIDMGFGALLFKATTVILVLEYVRAQEIFDDKYKDNWGHLNKIPRKFEVRAENAMSDFKKYIHDIQDLTVGKNLTVIYKVKVDVLDESRKMNRKKKLFKKIRSKKYNVPLKKQSMKLSHFELLLRKLAQENGQKTPNNEILAMISTTQPEKVMTTKVMQMKYKPIRRMVKTNFTKNIKPVRNKVITITV